MTSRLPLTRLKLLLVLMTTCSLSMGLVGCFDATEVENLNVVVGMGIDETNTGEVGVTLEIIKPMQRSQGMANEGERESFTQYRTGATIEDALDKMNDYSPRRMYYPHNTVIVFGEGYAKGGIDRAFDYLERERSYRRNELLLVTEGTARDLLHRVFVTQRVSALGLRQLLEQANRKCEAVMSEQLVVMRQYFEPSHTPLLAVVNLSDRGMPYLAGIGVMNRAKLSTVLHFPMACGLMWSLGNTEQIAVTFPLKQNAGQGPDTKTTVRLIRTARKLHVTHSGRHFVANLGISGDFEVEHLAGAKNLKPDVISAMEKQTAMEVKKEVVSVMHTLQSANVDGMQVASQLFRDEPQTWKRVATQWNDIYPQVDLHVNVQMNMLRSSLSGRPPVSVVTPSGALPARD